MVDGALLRRSVLVVVLGGTVAGMASCGGVQLDDAPEAGAGGESAASGRSNSTAGRGVGGATTGGSTSGQGGRASAAGTGPGTGGRGGQATNGGGGAGSGGGVGGRLATGGQAGESEPGGAGGVGGEAPDCSGSGNYEPGTYGMRCESSWSYGQGEGMVKVEEAATLEECKAACDARSDCTAVSDYFDTTGGHPCRISSEPCHAVEVDWAGEDGGLEYLKACPASGDCHLQFLGYGVRCNEAGGTGRLVPGATTLADCAAACLEDPTCVSVSDHTYLDDVIGCWLNIASCDAPVNVYQEGYLHRKRCD